MDCLNGGQFLVFQAGGIQPEQGGAFQDRGGEHEQ
jgi:hypothetical protein